MAYNIILCCDTTCQLVFLKLENLSVILSIDVCVIDFCLGVSTVRVQPTHPPFHALFLFSFHYNFHSVKWPQKKGNWR